MITLTPPHRPIPPAALRAPDGFAWWYLDLVDGSGNGLVLILASGLPFLPGPTRRPSLNLAVYGGGAEVFYVLQELEPHEAQFPADGSDTEISVGKTRLSVTRRDGRIVVRADIDVDVPGVARAVGTIVFEGVARVSSPVEGAAVASPESDVIHEWSPQTGPCHGRAELMLDGEKTVLAGRGYYDRNGSVLPIQSLGIDRWWWCRTAMEGNEGPFDRVAYVLWPTTSGAPMVLGMTVDHRGQTTCMDGLTLDVRRRRRTLYGMELFEHVALRAPDGAAFLDVECRSVVDTGPFYLRGLCDGGVFEHVAPHRIDLPRHRPFVAQRVVRASSAAMPFLLPYFSGHASSRLRRTLSFWRQRWLV